ncbi:MULTISPECIES: hypothetical protein [Nocardiaceae]|uniref:Uncharacterized protein n=1 Tax=Rhodococcoides kroppenstedtii TaxID=293050 RepID=A0ABS7NQF0_9NOCA|nr:MULTISPECIES: hypothetical protein [Rhodococcus]AMY18497.1 hypothetical protein A3Q40_01103 [Rhodococcus sp. PBTS 1]MBT1193809.1 hypothetical protein [Rhodococcus kroppenstedtii]MBY6312454.1 hypothetical protein [Rhodococcus kroppenstedtii]MBY6320234.1 hypothetical protein [Rhodococcus kroppenstedtii]MBY6398745.1 hypothetical protein [Rhodococcus kroppenstedtii]
MVSTLDACPELSAVLAPRSDRPFGYYVDRIFGYVVTVGTPRSDPSLWRRFLDGARASYARHGVDAALEFDRIADGRSTTLFFCALDDAGHPVAGARVQGPYERPDQTHADQEWIPVPAGRAALRELVAARLTDGVVELKTGWVDPAVPRDRRLADMIGFSGPLAGTVLGVRHTLVTAGDHALGLWEHAGAVLVDEVPPTPYPDARYRTRALFWDRTTYADRALPDHRRRIAVASEHVRRTALRAPDRARAAAAAHSSAGQRTP